MSASEFRSSSISEYENGENTAASSGQSVSDAAPIQDNSRPLLERDIQSFLEKNLRLLGADFSLVGREYRLPFGRIDLLAKDKNGHLIVIELKLGTATRDAIGQLQSYMGALQTAHTEKFIRGILVASSVDAGAQAALTVARDIKFFSYAVSFSFAEVLTSESTYAVWLKRQNEKAASESAVSAKHSNLWLPPGFNR